MSCWYCGSILVSNTKVGRFKPFYCYYRLQRSWAKVMFLQASVILLTGGVSASVHAGIHTPQEQTPPREQTHPSKQTPPGADTPPKQTPLGSRHPPKQTPPTSRHPPGADTPPESRLQHTVNERPVRVLLECILVTNIFVTEFSENI